MLENIRLSFQGVWSHKMRSFLTMLGIIIGIAAIIAIVSTIKGTNEQIKKNLVGAGNNLVEVQLYQDDYQYEMLYNGIPDGVPVLDDSVMEQLLQIPEVEAASFYTTRQDYNNSVFYKNQGASGTTINGIDSTYLETCGYQLKTGRGFVEDDFKNFRAVGLVDQALADVLFSGEYPVGKIVEVAGTPIQIIGVVCEKDSFEPVINSMEDYYQYKGNSSAGTLFVPSALWPTMYTFDEPQNVVLRATSTDEMANAGTAAQDILNVNVTNSDSIRYKAEDLLKQAEDLQNLSASTNQQLIWIASISLLVGGIGVMNIMLVSVTERTREIGLKKAIGARKSRILMQFLTEAAVLTSLGGLLGVLAGIGLAELISRLTQTPVAISMGVSLAAVLFSMVIGIIFGLLPSIKAANLNPIDALRHE